MIKLYFGPEGLLQLLTYERWAFQHSPCKEKYKRKTWEIRGKAI